MRKYLISLFAFVLIIYLIGCGQKKEEEFLTMDELGAINIESPTVTELQPEAKTQPIVRDIPPQPVPTIPPPPTATSVSAKPSSREIQTALKNAGYYIGGVDGKIGRLSKKAIEDFQEANGLKVDGKVGPKTWSVLSKYLAPAKKKR